MLHFERSFSRKKEPEGLSAMACEKVSESFPQEISVQLDKIIKNNYSGLQKFTKWKQQIKKCLFSITVGAEDKNSESLWPPCLGCSRSALVLTSMELVRNQKFCCQRGQTCGLCLYKLNVISKVENSMGGKSSVLLA